jgi:predicted acylesterase/phospholipase RssA
MERFVTKRNANHPFQKQHTLLYLDGIKLFNNFKTIVLESTNREYNDFGLCLWLHVIQTAVFTQSGHDLNSSSACVQTLDISID